jgi:hypothetical protein
MDPGEAGHVDQIVPQQLLPERLDRVDLGVEPVSADIEGVLLVPGGAGEPAHFRTGFDHGHGSAAAPEQVGSGQPGRAAATDQHPLISRPVEKVRPEGLSRRQVLSPEDRKI